MCVFENVKCKHNISIYIWKFSNSELLERNNKVGYFLDQFTFRAFSIEKWLLAFKENSHFIFHFQAKDEKL